jgi:hypothetical protein
MIEVKKFDEKNLIRELFEMKEVDMEQAQQSLYNNSCTLKYSEIPKYKMDLKFYSFCFYNYKDCGGRVTDLVDQVKSKSNDSMFRLTVEACKNENCKCGIKKQIVPGDKKSGYLICELECEGASKRACYIYILVRKEVVKGEGTASLVVYNRQTIFEIDGKFFEPCKTVFRGVWDLVENFNSLIKVKK